MTSGVAIRLVAMGLVGAVLSFAFGFNVAFGVVLVIGIWLMQHYGDLDAEAIRQWRARER